MQIGWDDEIDGRAKLYCMDLYEVKKCNKGSKIKQKSYP